MANQVELSIALPSHVYLEQKVDSVLLPAVRADVDILPDRAPSVFILDYGVVQILGRDGQPKARYFIKSGVADIANDQCRVMTSFILPFDDITPHLAKKKLEEVDDEDDKLFYEMVLDYQRGIRRRYLRTLNLFSDKSGLPRTYEETVEDVRTSLEELKKRGNKKK